MPISSALRLEKLKWNNGRAITFKLVEKKMFSSNYSLLKISICISEMSGTKKAR